MCMISLKICCGLSVLFILWPSVSVAFAPNQISQCESLGVPCHRDNEELCHMKYYKLNSVECKDMSFNKKLTVSSSEDSLGTVELKAFHYNILSYKLTAFNVTFSRVKWKHLKFRFKQVGNDIKNTCAEFFITANVTKNELYYDCIWSNETYEGKPFYFEYEVRDESRAEYNKYSFNVPIAKNIDKALTSIEDWEIFTYVEAVPVSNGLGSMKFVLHWQPVPNKFAIDVYNVSIISNDTGTLNVVHTESITCTNISLCSYEYSKWYGSLQFAVQPVCTSRSLCSSTKTLVFLIGSDKAKPLLFGIICATFAVPALLFCLVLARKYVMRKKFSVQESRPKVLMVYSSTTSYHADVVFALAEYLKNYCNVEPLVDEFHIFSSKTRDPFKWCNESLKAADFVMIIPSPCCRAKGAAAASNSVYRKTYALLLRLLRERLSDENSKKKFFVLMLPYVASRDVPRDAENLRRFRFPRDLDSVLRYMHESWIFPSFLGAKLPGGKEDFKLHGKQLASAIEKGRSIASRGKRQRLEMAIRDAGNDDDDDVDSDHELLTPKKRDAPCVPLDASIKGNKFLKKMAKDCFMDFPGNLNNFNLSGEEEEEEDDDDDDDEETPVRVSILLDDCDMLDVRELDL